LVNATLFFATTNGDTAATVPNSDKIIFNDTSKMFEPLVLANENNIKQTPNPTPDGSRIINVTENGLKVGTYPIKGFIKLSEADVDKLKSFTIIQQITSALPFGRFGIDYPNASVIELLPTDERGLSIGPYTLKHNATNKSLEFEYTMLFGGKLV